MYLVLHVIVLRGTAWNRNSQIIYVINFILLADYDPVMLTEV